MQWTMSTPSLAAKDGQKKESTWQKLDEYSRDYREINVQQHRYLEISLRLRQKDSAAE